MTASIPRGRCTRSTALAVTGLALAALVAACGGGDATTAAPPSSGAPAASPTGSPGPGGDRNGGFAGMDLAAVQSCLEAAGVSMPARPSFSGSGRPAFSPGGGGAGMFSSPEVKAALEACGITVPTFTPRNRPSQPTAAPSS
jgi:hypothetical protein